MDRVHFCCMDTDLMYLAISGSTIESDYHEMVVRLPKKRSYQVELSNRKEKASFVQFQIPVTQIQLKNDVMSTIKICKSALIGVVDKMIVIDSDISKGQSYPCAPQMMNVDASNYRYI
ncbi:MAG: hypothetical protein EZS28_012991 [Streblomastix strix]|uniref:Uncharacterized protein n=1 Tax=Streblomastix strix TaxID=222440 RepID=A0A5J4WAD4_9EUKA|nr:MAG: hypothetical protein EZS28_012991 [Streblomastix strix]